MLVTLRSRGRLAVRRLLDVGIGGGENKRLEMEIRRDERVSNPATSVLDGFASAIDRATCEGAGGCHARLDAARDEVVVWCHGRL